MMRICGSKRVDARLWAKRKKGVRVVIGDQGEVCLLRGRHSKGGSSKFEQLCFAHSVVLPGFEDTTDQHCTIYPAFLFPGKVMAGKRWRFVPVR